MWMAARDLRHFRTTVRDVWVDEACRTRLCAKRRIAPRRVFVRRGAAPLMPCGERASTDLVLRNTSVTCHVGFRVAVHRSVLGHV
jgi:hypothetical protein